MAAPGKGKTGSSSSRFGGKTRRLNNNKGGKDGNANTLGAVSHLTYATQAQIKRIRDKHRLLDKRRQRELLNRRRLRGAARLSFFNPGCQNALTIYGYTKSNVPGATKGKFLCKVAPFRESKYSTQPNEVRIFVEGAEVSSYTRGAITWSIQTTGGMNSCSFTLNNDSDAFIITPANVCADLNISGWRMSRSKKYQFHPGRESNRFDEAAKYIIYRNKYKMVNPTSKDGANIDETGMWLYPLNPYSVIFNKHDCVRVFTRLPHTMGVSRKIRGKQEWLGEQWTPAFTGFIRSCSWSDDPVGGDRSVKVDCYDYKGLMDRMRVRTVALRADLAPKKKTKDFDRSLLASGGSVNNVRGRRQLLADIRGRQFQALGLLPVLNSYRELLRTYYLYTSPAVDTTEGQKTAESKTKKDVRLVVADFDKQFAIATKASTQLKQTSGEGWTIRLGKNSKSIKFLKTDKSGGFTGAGHAGDQVSSYLNNLASVIVITEMSEYSAEGNPTNYQDGISDIWGKSLWTSTSSAGHVIQKLTFQRLLDQGSYNKSNSTARGIRESSYGLNRFKNGYTLWKETVAAVNAACQKQFKHDIFLAGTTDIIAIENFTWEQLTKWQTNCSTALSTYTKDISKTSSKAKEDGKAAAAQVEKIRDILLETLIPTLQRKIKTLAENKGVHGIRKVKDIIQKIRDARKTGQGKQAARVITAESAVTLWLKEPTFEGRTAGLFDDLVISVTKGSPHPLANMSFEQAIEWLLCEQTRIFLGVKEEIGRYKDGVMEEYNRNAIFGMIGRPLTFSEVGVVGGRTTSNYNEHEMSPYNAFYHLLVPATGTGASTIVQADITANHLGATTIQYATRLSLANQMCELLDFQFYINPMGDATIELPNYNILPADFGRTFGGAYRVQLEWKGGDINEEAIDLPTGWVFTGNENEAKAANATEAAFIKNQFQKVAIIAPILAKRLGVKVEHVNIEVPGVGSQVVPEDQRAGLDAIRVWGLVYIQRQLGQAHTISCPLPYRPFLLPNRPIHIVARQRIGIISDLNYSFNPPNGECTVDVGTRYVRWMHRDGTFRTIAGGFRQPVDFTGFFTGQQGFRVKEGVVGNMSDVSKTSYSAYKTSLAAQGLLNKQGKPKYDRNALAFSCSPALKDAYYDSQSSYGDDLGSFASKAFQYNASTAGSGGAAGTGQLPAVQNGTVGRPVRRPTSNKGQNEPGAAVTTAGTGLRASDNRHKDEKGKKKARYSITKLFYNPYPFGVGNSNAKLPDGGKTRFNNWINRYFDNNNLTGYNSGARGGKFAWHKAKTVPHSGIDILAPKGTDIIAPINSNWTYFNLLVGPQNEGSTKNPVKWESFKNEKEYNAAKKFVVNGKWSIDQPTGSGTQKVSGTYPMVEKKADGTLRAKVYIRQYKAWLASGKFSTKNVIRRSSRTASGLRIIMNGYVQPPKIQKNKSVTRGVKLNKTNSIYAKISIAHCSKLVLKKGVPPKAQKGDKVGEVGLTGAKFPHAHVDMWLYRKGSRPYKRRKGRTYYKSYIASDEDLFKAAASANREYMESLILLKVTGGKPDSNEISPRWQKYFKERGVKVGNVREAVEVLFKSNKWFQRNSSGTADSIMTNALLFFRPEEIVRGASGYDQYANVFYSTKPITGVGGEDNSTSSVCGKLPTAYSRKLRVELKSCLLKAGKVFQKFTKKGKKTYRYRRRLRCERDYKIGLAALERSWRLKQTQERSKQEQKLAAQTDRGLRDKAQRSGSSVATPKREA